MMAKVVGACLDRAALEDHDIRSEQRFVRQLELRLEISGPLAPVHVVAQHDHEIECKCGARARHHVRDVVLGPIPCARIADDGEILVDQRTCAVVRDDRGMRALEKFPERLKGFPEPVPVYALSTSAVQQDRDERRSRRRRRRRFWAQLLRPPKPRST